MTALNLRRWLRRIAFGGLVFFAPLLWARALYPVTPVDELVPAQAALIFGAVVRDGSISPLHEERLRAGMDLLERDLVQTLVVSNTAEAATTMRAWLIAQGVPDRQIEVDPEADQTPDTCRYELRERGGRDVIFVSQSFHLPRLSMQCGWVGLAGQALAAETYRAAGPSGLSQWRVLQIRVKRHAREAGLLWAGFLGLYDGLGVSDEP